jgi:hypothetical protein
MFTKEGGMARLLKKTHLAGIIFIVMALILVLPSTIYSYRGPEARFLGRVTLDRQNVPAGSIVTAYIGSLSWKTQVYLKGASDSWYAIDVPANKGTGSKNGGTDKDLVRFTLTINGTTYDDPKTEEWKQSEDIDHSIRIITSPANPLLMESPPLPEGAVGASYGEHQFKATGGTQPYFWSSQGLPEGLLFTDGLLHGTPLAEGVFTARFIVIDSTQTVSKQDWDDIVITIWKLGDADRDGNIDRDDVLYVVKIYLGVAPVTPGADANLDGKINLRDAIVIRNMIKPKP